MKWSVKLVLEQRVLVKQMQDPTIDLLDTKGRLTEMYGEGRMQHEILDREVVPIKRDDVDLWQKKGYVVTFLHDSTPALLKERMRFTVDVPSMNKGHLAAEQIQTKLGNIFANVQLIATRFTDVDVVVKEDICTSPSKLDDLSSSAT